ncbi:MAG: hypothetical protein IPN94_20760 [Sphingobacteriales bacterium]|nr:hypothetical protein [Sphingobacteriales bacterium]
MKKLFQTFLLIVVVATLFLTQSVKGQTYLNNFGTTTISGTTYSGTPSPLDANISSSVWSTSAPSFTSFTGSTGQALAINSFVVGSTRTITLTMDLNTCYVANITGVSLWRQRSTNGPTAMDVSINGTTIASGVAVPTTEQ